MKFIWKDTTSTDSELREAAEKLKIPGFIGVMRKKNVNPEHFRAGNSAIINLDDFGGGSHWVCYYLPDDDTIWYFGSYGMPPFRKIEKFAENKNKPLRRVYYNTSNIQHVKSRSCGWYCLDFLRHVVGWEDGSDLTPFANFIYKFDVDPTINNEKIVNSLIKQIKYEGPR